MKTDMKKPCGNCPFLTSAPLAHWCPEHYKMLSEMRAHESSLVSRRLFMCHKGRHSPPDQQGLCVGWMLDQRRRGTPSITLLLHLATSKALASQYQSISGESECYESIDDLVLANLDRDRELHPDRYLTNKPTKGKGPCTKT